MSSLLQPVVAHVKSKEVDWGVVRAYPHDNGHTYKVPVYDMEVSGLGPSATAKTTVFKVIRFGVKQSSASDTPTVVGLKDKQVHILSRVDYMEGSWQLYGNFLIHDGANNPQKSAWGQIGCIEVVGMMGGKDAWKVFEALVLSLSGAKTAAKLGKSGKFSIKIDAVATRPPLVEHS
ncbi:MAG: hypothetical protein AAFY65_02595 [Pseudomonadota bacterium]